MISGFAKSTHFKATSANRSLVWTTLSGTELLKPPLISLAHYSAKYYLASYHHNVDARAKGLNFTASTQGLRPSAGPKVLIISTSSPNLNSKSWRLIVGRSYGIEWIRTSMAIHTCHA